MSDTNSGYHEPNVPYRYTQKAQDERNWKKTLDNSNFTRTIGQKQKYRNNYDDINWSKK